MTNRVLDTAQRRAAIAAGCSFVYIIVGSIVTMDFVRPRLVIPEDLASTATNIAANRLLFRVSSVNELLMAAGVMIVLAWALFVLLEPVNKNLALLALSFRLAEATLWCGAVLVNYVLLQVVCSGSPAGALEERQMHTMVGMLLRLNTTGMDIVILFTGLGTFVFSILLWKSRYVPRLLAAWGILTYFTMIVYSCTKLVFPDLAKWDMIVYTPGGLFEAVIGVWLLVAGLTARAAVGVEVA